MAYTTIDDPSAYFQTTTYAGDSSNSTVITNGGNSDLQPDFVWIKNRTLAGGGSSNHMLFNSSVGIGTGANSPYLQSSSDSPEATNSNGLQAVSSNGFTPGSMTRTNETNSNFVAWQWKANGGTTSSNTVGTITSTVQANTDAGFSIYTYTGTGAAGTVGHGLGGLPDMIILKGRNTTSSWPVYMDPQRDGSLQFPRLNGTEGNIGNSPFTWDTTKFTFSSGSSYSNTSGTNYIAYAFRSIQGYSKFGTYVGNGSADGPFAYLGFKPAFVLTKRTDTTGGWTIYDNKRGYNGNNYELFPHSSEAEYTGTSYFEADILSNGFKLRQTDGQINASGGTYIYMAFAESPFVAGGVPTTAR